MTPRRHWVPWRHRSVTFKVVSAAALALLASSLLLRFNGHPELSFWIMAAGFMALVVRPGFVRR